MPPTFSYNATFTTFGNRPPVGSRVGTVYGLGSDRGRTTAAGRTLRVGYGLASREVADLLNRARQPFNTNAIAQAAALAAMEDDEHVARTVANNSEGLAFLQEAFEERSLRYVPSVANFVLLEVGDGDVLFEKMLSQGVIVRAMRGYKLPAWLRVSIGTRKQNERFLEVLDREMSS